MYYSIDYVFGYILKIRPILNRRNIVIFDRYYTDVIADSRRSRIFLNPNDAVLLKNRKSDSEYPVKILSDHRLTRGSARAVMGDSIIESMKENRVADIVNQILGEKNKKTVKSLRKKTTSSSDIKSVKK